MIDLAPRRTGGSELSTRVVSAFVMAAGILAVTWIGGPVFRVTWAVVGALVAYEWLRIVGASAERALVVGAAMVVAGIVGIWSVTASVGLLAALVVADGNVGSRLAIPVPAPAPVPSEIALPVAGRRTGLRAAGIFYGAVLVVAPPALRDVESIGLWLIAWSFAVVWFSDIAAFFAGRAIGGPKLLPRVSPKKTWSGAIGGWVAGVVGGLAIWEAGRRAGAPVPFSALTVGLISFVCTALGQAGDLAESALKRHFEVKDSSRLIPGHGGFMDRLDAYWAVIGFAGFVLFLATLSA